MQSRPLTIGLLIDHAERAHGATEIVAKRHDGAIERSNWARVAERARRVATALTALGAGRGDRVATLGWNRTAHLELYFGVTAAGMVLHTVNPRLFADQISYIINHGGARIVFVDPDLLPILESLLPDLPAIEYIVILCDRASMPVTRLTGLLAYEDVVQNAEPLRAWPPLVEDSAASLCYTSGTTGNPKGVLYSHRSILLHAFASCAADSMALSATDSILLVTPLFHVNAWGIPFASAMCGAKLVLPGSDLDGASLYALLRDERVTFSLGVPTIWFTLLDYLASETTGDQRAALALGRIFMGGAATPRALIERFRDLLGVETIQAWGMTETSPVATVCRPLAHQTNLEGDARTDLRASQGRAIFGVELRIEDADGAGLPHDGIAAGFLKVRGPWVINGYFGNEPGSAIDDGGWLDTGDVASIDPDGFVRLTDRAKDVIKSGGEWISSIDLENAAASHPAVAEAAVIGVPHPRWQERPLMLLRTHPGAVVDRADILEHLKAHVARWWLPDDVLFVDTLPHTATGKLLKTQLRQTYCDHLAA